MVQAIFTSTMTMLWQLAHRSRDFETHNKGEMNVSSVNEMSGPEENAGQLSEELRSKVRALLGQL